VGRLKVLSLMILMLCGFWIVSPIPNPQNSGSISSYGTVTEATEREASYGAITEAEVYRGFACDEASFIYGKYTREHFREIKQWGFDCVLVTFWWTGSIERNKGAVGVYSEQNLQGLRRSVDLVLNEGLKVIISGRVCYDPYTEVGWDGWATHDYVNMHDEGLNRYAKFWEMIVQRFPDCMYCLWHFPYHKQGASEEARNRYYTVTFPTLLNAVRKYSDNKVIFVPIHQGATRNGETSDYYLTANPIDDDNIIYGLGHMMPWNVIDYGTWNYDIERVDEAFAGVKRWTQTFKLPMMSVEYTPLAWVRGKIIEKSRLACLSEILNRMSLYNIGWMYWRLSLTQKGGDNILANIENFEPNTSILTLLHL
jgi:hypothetical protein